MRQAPIHSVGLHGDAGVLPRLTELVKTDTAPLLREAAMAYGRIRKKEAVPALMVGLNTSPTVSSITPSSMLSFRLPIAIPWSPPCVTPVGPFVAAPSSRSIRWTAAICRVRW